MNFDLEVANKLQTNINTGTTNTIVTKEVENEEVPESLNAEEETNFPEIVDPTKKITKSKAKRTKSKSKAMQRQNSKEKKDGKPKGDVDIEWDFEENKAKGERQKKGEMEQAKRFDDDFLRAETKYMEEERLREYEGANGRQKGLTAFG